MSDFNDAVEGIDEGDAVPRSWQAGPAIVAVLDGAPASLSARSSRPGA